MLQMVNEPIGGVQGLIAEVFPRLLDQFRIVFIDLNNQPEFAATMRKAGVEVVEFGRPQTRRFIGGKGTLLRPFYLMGRSPWLLRSMWRFSRWVARERPDVVYFHQLPLARVFGRLISRHNVGLVYHEHGIRSPDHVGRRTAKFLSRRFARVVAVSNLMARFLVEAGVDPHKVRVVYNGIDAAAIQRAAESTPASFPEVSSDTVVFVQIGVLTRQKKAQHLTIEALGRLPPNSKALLRICGDVPSGADPHYLAELKRQVADLGLKDRVHFLGWRQDVPAVVKASDVCILPSISHCESFGLVLIEAMAQGKPCIGSTFGGIPEVIEDGVTGLVCEPTVEKLAAAMTRMLESVDTRQSMGEAGRRRVESLFSLERQTGAVADAIRHALPGTA